MLELRLDFFDPFELPCVAIEDVSFLPEVSGVYFVLRKPAILYVGKTLNLRGRWQNHEKRHLFDDIDNVKVSAFMCGKSLIDIVERQCIDAFQPRFNVQLAVSTVHSQTETNGIKRLTPENKIEKTVLAIMEWNKDKPLSLQIEINVGSLRRLSKANASKVGKWVKDNRQALAEYASKQGHPFNAQSKFNRGKDLSVVSLPWL